MREDEIIVFVVMMFVVVIALAIQVLINFFYFKCLSEVPEEHRTMQPGMVFINLIPCVNIVWIFLVVNAISKSYESYFETLDDPHVKVQFGDCGAMLGMSYAVLCLLSAIPYVNCLTSIPSLVVFIILMLKYNEMRKFAQVANAMQ